MIAILATLALLATLLVPMAAPAGAATGAAVLQVPNVSDNAWQKLGTVKIEVDAGGIDDNHIVTVTLPSGFKFYDKTAAWAANFDNTTGTYNLFNDNGAGGGTAGDGLPNGSETIWARVVIPKTYSGNANDLWGSAATCQNVFTITVPGHFNLD